MQLLDYFGGKLSGGTIAGVLGAGGGRGSKRIICCPVRVVLGGRRVRRLRERRLGEKIQHKGYGFAPNFSFLREACKIYVLLFSLAKAVSTRQSYGIPAHKKRSYKVRSRRWESFTTKGILLLVYAVT